MFKKLIMLTITSAALAACTKSETKSDEGVGGNSEQAVSGSVDTGIGVGPMTSVTIESEISQDLVKKGGEVFTAKCAACHKIEERYVGPALKGVTTRRKPEWIMNMILNPVEMTQKDPTAQELLGEYMTQMANQNLTQEEARAVLEYFRNNDKK